jgi:hypothetical protein
MEIVVAEKNRGLTIPDPFQGRKTRTRTAETRAGGMVQGDFSRDPLKRSMLAGETLGTLRPFSAI